MTRQLSQWLLVLALASTAQATEVKWPLKGKKTASGTFQQTVTDINGTLAFSSAGRFAALRPSHYRWEIESPDRQLLVATPEGLWQWDKDLEVVILRDAPDIADLPISAIWSGSVEMRPKQEADGGQIGNDMKGLSVRSPDDDTIVVLFEDSLGQQTRFEFTLDKQSRVPSSAFKVEVPEGVDFYNEKSRPLEFSGATE